MSIDKTKTFLLKPAKWLKISIILKKLEVFLILFLNFFKVRDAYHISGIIL